MLLPGDGACVRAVAKSNPVGILALTQAPPECINRPADAFWHLCIFPPQAGLCSACFAKLYVAAIKPPVGELTYLVELSGGLPTTTLRQGEKTTTSGYLARQSCAYDRT